MNKVALVTGGAKRVGRAIALTLAQAGYDIAFTWNKSKQEAQELEKIISLIGRKVVSVQVDKNDPDAIEIIFDQFNKKFNRLDALINNASCFEPSTFGEINKQQFDRDMTINARAPLFLTQKFSTMLAARYKKNDPSSTGRVVNFIDTHVLGETLREYTSYNASKAALLEITNSCALELAPKITVNAIAPGVVAWADFYTEETKKEYLKRVPLARAGSEEDAASAVKYLIVDAHYCTGQVIQVDGGRHLT
ncbi:MAG: SDR family oxidoreductase [Gammaproteobacteria bacterium]